MPKSKGDHRRLSVSAAFVSLVAACSSPQTLNDSCNDDTDCNPGRVCVTNHCMSPVGPGPGGGAGAPSAGGAPSTGGGGDIGGGGSAMGGAGRNAPTGGNAGSSGGAPGMGASEPSRCGVG